MLTVACCIAQTPLAGFVFSNWQALQQIHNKSNKIGLPQVMVDIPTCLLFVIAAIEFLCLKKFVLPRLSDSRLPCRPAAPIVSLWYTHKQLLVQHNIEDRCI